MRSYLAAFLIALIAGAALTPLVRILAFRVGAVSRPGGRHVHSSVVPRLGGLAIFVGLVFPIASLLFVDSSVARFFRAEGYKGLGLLVGATVMCLVGFADDVRGMRVVFKLAAQLAVASFAFLCGYRIQAITLPLVGNLSMGVFAFPITVIWITGIINAVNLIDGLDGLAAGVVLFAALTNFVIAGIAGTVFIAVVMAATIGAVLGFLLFNFNPARIFMGDSGSYVLGYVLGTSSLVGATSQKASTAVALLVPCLALGVPIFDTLFSIVRRFLERRPIFSADRGHIHHRLLDIGLTHRRAVLTIYAVSAVFSVSAIAASIGKNWQVGVALLASSIVLFALVRAAGYVDYIRQYLRGANRNRHTQSQPLRLVLPSVIEKLVVAQTETDVRLALQSLVQEGALSDVALVDDTSTLRPPVSPTSGRNDVTYLEVRLPLVPLEGVRSEVHFRWCSEHAASGVETEIVLEVLVDVLRRTLLRLGSPLVSVSGLPATPSATARRSRAVAATPTIET